jgi:hypothetical protein
MNPAKAEQIAPSTKDKATKGEDPSVFPLIPNKIATPNTKIAKTLYSALRKAIAPSEIFSAILAIFGVPTSCFETQEDFQKVKSNAMTPKTGIA